MSDTKTEQEPAAILTIAGFDPSGNAGIIADVRTFQAFGCWPLAVITSITFQNSHRVFGAVHQTSESLVSQVLPITEQFRISAVKIGMLPTSEIVLTVAKLLRQHDLPLPVLDPVMQSSSGGELMAKAAVEIMVNELMPLTRVMTPNIPEAETLTGLRIINEDDMCEAAQKLRTMGARAVLVKGGHLEQRSEVRGQRAEHVDQIKDVQPFNEVSRQAIDVLNDQDQITVFREDWIDSRPVRGTGCVLSSAIAACLGQRMELREAVAAAKRFVIDIIRDAPKFGPNTDSFELTEMSVLKE